MHRQTCNELLTLTGGELIPTSFVWNEAERSFKIFYIDCGKLSCNLNWSETKSEHSVEKQSKHDFFGLKKPRK